MSDYGQQGGGQGAPQWGEPQPPTGQEQWGQTQPSAGQAPQWGQVPPGQVPTQQVVYPVQQPKKSRSPLMIRLVVLGVIVLVGLGYTLYKHSQSASVSSNGTVTKAGNLSVFSLKKGECFNEPATGQDVSTIKAIPCDQPHDAQVTGTATLTETSYDSDAINQDAGSQCSTVADSAVDSSKLGDNASVIYFVPDEDDFNTNNDRTVTCAVDNGGTKLTSSVLSGD